MGLSPASSQGGGGGGGTVTSVTAADASIVVAGTAVAPTVATGPLNAIAALHAATAAVDLASHKITSMSDGTVANDGATFGQIPTALPPTALSVTNASVAAAAGIVPTKLAAGTAGQTLRAPSGVNTWIATPSIGGTPGNESTSSTAAFVMAGFAQAITPTFSGTLIVLYAGSAVNGVSNDGGSAQVAFGTGVAPVNGAAATGTVVGASVRADSPSTLNIPLPLVARITGATIGTALWVDLQIKAQIGGSFTLFAPNFVVIEV